ncbi:MAG: hypothetical protein D6791_14505, partial [Chloroflexi bacterium]
MQQLESSFERAEKLIERGRSQEAIELLEPLLQRHPRVPELHYFLGYARASAGDFWRALTSYERALQLSRDPAYWIPLASLYLNLDLHVHALHAFRELFRQQAELPMADEARQVMASLEQEVLDIALHLEISVEEAERGLHYWEEGRRTLQAGDFPACIAANRRAIKVLGDWPPPHNNLSLGLFFNGQPEEAIAVARKVLSYDPDNIQALSNTIRFLAWTGREGEARQFWERLRDIPPQSEADRMKKAEAAAVLDEDESVYELLKPLDSTDEVTNGVAQGSWRDQLFLAIAEANTNRRRAAKRRLKAMQHIAPWIEELLTALDAGQPGPGWAERFPYFHSSEMISGQAMETFVDLVSHEEEMSPRRFRREVERFLARYPQLIQVAEKLIWEESQAEVGISILTVIGTPAAYSALR